MNLLEDILPEGGMGEFDVHDTDMADVHDVNDGHENDIQESQDVQDADPLPLDDPVEEEKEIPGITQILHV